MALSLGCSSATRTALTSSPAAQPGRAPRHPHCWAAFLPRPFLGLGLCPPMVGIQERMGGISSRTWACFPCPERKPAAQTLPVPGSSTACGSPVTIGTWRTGYSQHPWLLSHPLHRQVPCPQASTIIPIIYPQPRFSVPHGSDSLTSCYGEHIPSTPHTPAAVSPVHGPHADAEHPTRCCILCRCCPKETGLPPG